ncbi:MAG: UbiX family flavin prenyltransferase [Phycisphaeraceae bacterium]|nr:UbiX family flavin prenyltransferase [Phycisphaeraceae bacterium]MCB9847025.1 UbiX family flavin prenyltransferase [Phycisphaeraceae bacterium]
MSAQSTQHPSGLRHNRVVVGVTGASGALYARRVLRGLLDSDVESHVVLTNPGLRLCHDELGAERPSAAALAGIDDDHPQRSLLHQHSNNDIGAPIASGSFLYDAMLVVPCSANSLNAIACGLGDDLLRRAAAVTLKERRRLVLALRESPLTLIDAQHIATLTAAGAIVAPASPGFYLNPTTIDDLIDFVAAKLLDSAGVTHNIGARWGDTAKPSAR